jgi:hypothetical protein
MKRRVQRTETEFMFMQKEIWGAGLKKDASAYRNRGGELSKLVIEEIQGNLT